MKLTVFAFCLFLFSSTFAFCQNVELRSRDYKKADSIAGLYPRYSLDNLRMLCEKLTSSLRTDEEKFRAIYTWVSSNIDNDYSMYLKNKRNRAKAKTAEELKAWNNAFSAEVFRELRKNYRTVCTGYAYLVRELASFAGINCKIVDGYGRNVTANIGGYGVVNHSWNVVQLNDKWYLCDPTWSSGAIDPEKRLFVKNFDDSYFLADPELFVRNHYPLDTSLILMSPKPTLEAFLNRPLLYVNAYHYRVTPVSHDAFNIVVKKGEKIVFKFTGGGKPIAEMELHLENTGTFDPVVVQEQEDLSLLYSIEHTFNGRGVYAVHILADGNYLYSYNVTVK